MSFPTDLMHIKPITTRINKAPTEFKIRATPTNPPHTKNPDSNDAACQLAIENSIVLEQSLISDLATRVTDSLIGKNVRIHYRKSTSQAYSFMLGDNSEVNIS